MGIYLPKIVKLKNPVVSIDGLAPEIRVGSTSPPTFFAHAGDTGGRSRHSAGLLLRVRRPDGRRS